MPNRIIKESICTSSEIYQLKPEEEIFFYRLLVTCDDYGRAEARPSVLRSRCFPLKIDQINDHDIINWLRALICNHLIAIYITDGKPYVQVKTWEKHQQVRAKRSKYPSPGTVYDGVKSFDSICNQLLAIVPVIQSLSESLSESITTTTPCSPPNVVMVTNPKNLPVKNTEGLPETLPAPVTDSPLVAAVPPPSEAVNASKSHERKSREAGDVAVDQAVAESKSQKKSAEGPPTPEQELTSRVVGQLLEAGIACVSARDSDTVHEIVTQHGEHLDWIPQAIKSCREKWGQVLYPKNILTCLERWAAAGGPNDNLTRFPQDRQERGGNGHGQPKTNSRQLPKTYTKPDDFRRQTSRAAPGGPET